MGLVRPKQVLYLRLVVIRSIFGYIEIEYLLLYSPELNEIEHY